MASPQTTPSQPQQQQNGKVAQTSMSPQNSPQQQQQQFISLQNAVVQSPGNANGMQAIQGIQTIQGIQAIPGIQGAAQGQQVAIAGGVANQALGQQIITLPGTETKSFLMIRS